ncbi:hypothetical protein [Lactiplantibacillus daowaiensis]|uniref:Polysaccharide polymerase n=1 Tax=Lactiplantibacillus daowaiensis TaxID=2559918 RepID=A0ABW1RWC5_9LACO|nr:hypothetical protein [Lactiplantibacillus daowaiensis]
MIESFNILKAEKRESLREKLFFWLYAIYETCYYFLGTSNINTFFNTTRVTMIINLCVMVGLFMFSITNRYTFDQFLLVISSLILGLFAFFIVGKNVLLMGLMFAIAAKNINLNRFIRKDFTLRTVLLGIILIANRVGWIPSRIALRGGGSTVVRDSLGFNQFNVTGALIMICILEYLYLNFGNISNNTYVIIVMITGIMFYLTNSRGPMLAIVLYLVICWMKQKQEKYYNGIMTRLCEYAKYLFVLLSVLSMAAVVFFKYDNSTWQVINKLSSDRINILNQYFNEFGISLLPQKVSDYRSAGIIVMDNVYATLAIQYGLLILIVFAVFYYILCKNAFVKNNIAFVWLLITLMLFGLIESTFFMASINFTIMMVFTNLSPVKSLESGGEKK